jgi:phosphohistidine phosphatase
MNLYLLRHGDAEPRQSDDPQRALTHRGRLDVQSVAREFAARGITLSACYYSPFLRTAQTCSLFLAEAEQTVKSEPLPLLTPGHRASQVLGFLQRIGAEDVLLVTHNPLVSELMAVLTDTPIDSMHIFATSELSVLTCETVSRGGASLRFRLLAQG